MGSPNYTGIVFIIFSTALKGTAVISNELIVVYLVCRTISLGMDAGNDTRVTYVFRFPSLSSLQSATAMGFGRHAPFYHC